MPPKSKVLSKQQRTHLINEVVSFSKSGRAEDLEALLAPLPKADAKRIVCEPDKNGSTPIYHTVWPGHHEALAVLIKYGASVNHQNIRQNTAMHLACEQGRETCITHLINAGADIMLTNALGKTVWMTLENPLEQVKMEEFVKRKKQEYEDRKWQALLNTFTEYEQRQYLRLFEVIDADQDGIITLDELVPWLQREVEPVPELATQFFRKVNSAAGRCRRASIAATQAVIRERLQTKHAARRGSKRAGARRVSGTASKSANASVEVKETAETKTSVATATASDGLRSGRATPPYSAFGDDPDRVNDFMDSSESDSDDDIKLLDDPLEQDLANPHIFLPFNPTNVPLPPTAYDYVDVAPFFSWFDTNKDGGIDLREFMAKIAIHKIEEDARKQKRRHKSKKKRSKSGQRKSQK